MSTARDPDGPGEQRIPTKDPSLLPPIEETRKYVISAKVEGGLLQFYYALRPETAHHLDDTHLQIQVHKNCRIELELDSALQWEFRNGTADSLLSDAVTLGDTARPFYFNLRAETSRRVSFYALFDDSNKSANNRDPYNIHVSLKQKTTGSKRAAMLPIRIDPDIENPGGHN